MALPADSSFPRRRTFLNVVGAGMAARGLPAARPTPALGGADVAVVGGGPAGIGAALSAARAGAKTLLLERYGFCGGVGAWSVGMNINQMRPGGRPRSAVHESLIERLISYGGEAVQVEDHALVCNVEYLPASILPTPFPLKNALSINHTGTRLRGVLDGSRPEEITEAERYSRRQALQIVGALREFGGPPFAAAQLAATGPQVGVRETRRIRGVYALTEEDAKSGRRFDDAVAWRSGKIDVGGGGTDYDMKIHHVPYRAILPAKLDGLLVGGRCISATHIGAAAGKSMGNCMATGHAAGVAVAMAATKGRSPREVDVGEVQRVLARHGVDLSRA